MTDLQTSSSTDRTFLGFDGYNIVRRVYGAVPGDDSKEKAEGALRSSIGSFKRALKDFNPTHALAAFDYEGRTFRHEMYDKYKLTRSPMPDELRQVMPTFFDMLRDIGVPVVCIEGVEAEDVLATASLKWVGGGKGEAIVMSTDKDVATLAPAGIRVRDQFQKIWLDDQWCQKRFGIPVELLSDFLSLVGDPTDGIPGVPKVGGKTAIKLFAQYGNLDGILANIDAIEGTLGQRLRDNLELLQMSCALVSLKTDVVLNMTWNNMLYTPPSTRRMTA